MMGVLVVMWAAGGLAALAAAFYLGRAGFFQARADDAQKQAEAWGEIRDGWARLRDAQRAVLK